jgi:FkbM family methyltransferase
LKVLLKSVLKRWGVRVFRTPGNRFDALDEVMNTLRVNGFRPSGILDAGANLGQWAEKVALHYPGVPIALIEPQPACRASLNAYRARFPHASIEQVAVTSPGVESVWIDAVVWEEGSSCTCVVSEDCSPDQRVRVAATTLDAILSRLNPSFAEGPIFLKLDLEGHEVEALRGATVALSKIEVIWSETRLLGASFDVPCDFEALLDFARAAGFIVYDFVSLSGRPYDNRLRMMDVVFVRRGGLLDSERRWVVGSPDSERRFGGLKIMPK